MALFGRQPITESDSELLHAFGSADARSQIGAEKAAVRRFVGQTAHRPEPKINRSGRQAPGFQVDVIPEYDGLVECEAWLRAIPVNKLIDGRYPC